MKPIRPPAKWILLIDWYYYSLDNIIIHFHIAVVYLNCEKQRRAIYKDIFGDAVLYVRIREQIPDDLIINDCKTAACALDDVSNGSFQHYRPALGVRIIRIVA